MTKGADVMEKIVSLCKRRGFVFPGSEIYGGFAGTYDWGPYGVELRKNVVNEWTYAMQMHGEMALLDSSIFTAPKVWEASGHVSGFNDPLVVCLECHSKLRADHLLEGVGVEADEKMSEAKLNDLFDSARPDLVCPVCGKKNFGRVVQKNLMATSTLGKLGDEDQDVYLRAETAQGIYINYKNILNTGYTVPFGIAQVGKAFRNEISPRQFLFRKREFEQMEMQYFVSPDAAPREYEAWRQERMAYYLERLGIRKEKIRWKRHDNLVFYAKDAWDIQYDYPFGWSELEGIHYRGDYDLTQHQKFSGMDMSYFDEETKERYIPHVIETSVGVDRTVLMLLADAYTEDEMNGEKRVVLRFSPAMAPVKAAVFPLLKNKPELVAKAREVYTMLKKEITQVMWDDNGNIGKRYRRQDEIGTPHCITVDFDTLGEKPELLDTVTVRHRDNGEQERLAIKDLTAYLKKEIEG